MSNSGTPVVSPKMAADLRKKVRRFRILVIGQANAGKTTILQKVCNTTDQPEIFDKKGNKLDQNILNPTGGRGIHDINNELIFQSSPGFVFHDSRGFEAGADDELNFVKDFLDSRLKERELDQQLHAIWYCLPLDNSRPISKAEETFFDECGTGKVPVILIFTKFDGYIKLWFSNLVNGGANRAQAKAEAASYAENGLNDLTKRLSKFKYSPRKCVHLGDMHKPEATCKDLIEQTSDALDDGILTQIFISTQQVTARLATKYAIKELLKNSNDKLEDLLYIMSAWYCHSEEDILDILVDHMSKHEYTNFSKIIPQHLSNLVFSEPDMKKKIFLGLSLAIVAEHSFPVFGFQGSFEQSLALYVHSPNCKNVLKAVSNIIDNISFLNKLKHIFKKERQAIDEEQLLDIVDKNIMF